MRVIIFLFISIFSFYSAISQQVTPVDIPYFESGACDGMLKVNQSDKIENFIETYAGINKKRSGIWGYRVRIYSDVGSNARKMANETKVKFNNDYPSIKAYLVYNNPNFEVHCGNFRTRFEAMGFLNKIKPSYPGSFIIYEIIEFPDL